MAIDIDQSFYNTGTATVAANGVIVTGQGTSWLGPLRANDMFGTHVGMPTRILSVDSDTQLTLAWPWKGPAQTAASYEVTFTPYKSGYQEAVRQLLLLLAAGNLEAIADLESAADTLAYFTGAGTAALTDLTAFMRLLLSKGNAADALKQLTDTTASIELGSLMTGDRASYVDFHADDVNVDYSARILRLGGENGRLDIVNKGSGGITLNAQTPWAGAQAAFSSTYPLMFQKFPSGLILMGGSSVPNISGTTGMGNIVFPIAFPNRCFLVTGCCGDVVNKDKIVWFDSPINLGYVDLGLSPAPTSDTVLRVNWMAFGL